MENHENHGKPPFFIGDTVHLHSSWISQPAMFVYQT